MLGQCFTCLPPRGFSVVERPRWGRQQPPPPWCPDPVNRPGRGLSAVMLPSNPYQTLFTPDQRTWMSESPDMFYGLEEITPLEIKGGAALAGAALLGLALWFTR